MALNTPAAHDKLREALTLEASPGINWATLQTLERLNNPEFLSDIWLLESSSQRTSTGIKLAEEARRVANHLRRS